MAILIRDITEDQERALEAIKTAYYEKTNSKAVLAVLDRWMKDQDQLRRLKAEISALKTENHRFKECFKQIQWSIETGLDEEDDSDMY